MSYDYVKRMYGVNPVVGDRVRHHTSRRHQFGTIAREKPSQSHYVMVRFDGEERAMPCHPTEMDYLGPVAATPSTPVILTSPLPDRGIVRVEKALEGGE